MAKGEKNGKLKELLEDKSIPDNNQLGTGKESTQRTVHTEEGSEWSRFHHPGIRNHFDQHVFGGGCGMS